MRITLNQIGDAYFSLSIANSLENSTVKITLPQVHDKKIRANLELSMFLTMLPPNECKYSEEFSGNTYSITGVKNIFLTLKGIMNAEFFLHKDNCDAYLNFLSGLVMLGFNPNQDQVRNMAIRWHLRLLKYVIATHEYTLRGGGVRVEELNKSLSHHAAKIYEELKLLLNKEDPIPLHEYESFVEYIKKDLPKAELEKSEKEGTFTLYKRAGTTNTLYSDINSILDKSKIALIKLAEKLQYKALDAAPLIEITPDNKPPAERSASPSP